PTCSGAKWRSWRRAAAWNVDARTPEASSAASRARSWPAALSVNVTAMICARPNAPVATWCAMRRVIVVVLPVPAPARMQTGPRTASAARRCSRFRPARASTGSRYRRPRRAAATSVQRVFQDPFAANAVRLLDHRREPRDDAQRVPLVDEPLELGELLLEPVVADHGPRGTHDLRVRGGADGLAVVPEHLVDLLARPRAGEDDGHVGLPGEANHLLREVEDPDRLAHVEHVHLAAAAHRARLHDERRSLRDRHEEPGHLGARDGDGPAALDLPAEDRDHRARRAEHVAEAHRDEPGVDVVAEREGLDDPFAHGLRLPHHVLGARRLVG